MTAWGPLVVLVVLVLIAAMSSVFGADSRPGVDRPPEGWWHHRR